MAPPDGENVTTNAAGAVGDSGAGAAPVAGGANGADAAAAASDAVKNAAADAAKGADAGTGADAGKADAAKGADQAKATDAGKSQDAPIDYAGLKMPEGYTTKTDDPVFGEVLGIFNKFKVPTEGAQELLNFTVERDKAMHKAFNESQQDAWKKTRGEWKTATEKAVTPEDRGVAKTAAERLFDPKTAELLEAFGLTDHQGFIQALVKVGKAISNDTFVGGNAALNGARDARSHFPNSNMNP